MNAPSGCVSCSDGSQQFDSKHDADCSEGEDAQIRMAPHVQAYLARNNPTTNCCGLTIPIAFERAATGTWWNPRFDSDILEGQYRSSSFRQIRLRFRFALLYILIFSISWFVYFVALGLNGITVKWPFLCSIFAGVLLITSVMLFVTFTNIYKVYTFKLSLVMALALCTLSLSLVTLTTRSDTEMSQAADISQSGHFTMCIEILLIIYTLTPLPLYACVIIGILYSIVFEVLNIVLHLSEQEWQCPGMFVRILLQLCVHIIGVHIYLMTFVRMRGTFMKVGQSLLVRKQLEMEKQLKEKMIHSVMPPKVASWLLEEQVLETETNIKTHNPLKPRHSNPGASDIKSLFRPFNMSSMDNVSILFADIVGFTRMSSNKGAEELVNILNDLFEKFDELCQNHGCEKISTLGDCYYCVSGCPEPRPDHATCCVEMGLGMIDAIKEFDRVRGEGINMRVGVHTGTVLCGIVGTRRFKFDVWSNDVSFANKMESTGKPGRVHISEETAKFLGGSYILEEGDDVFGHKTYFIEGRQLYSPYNHDNCLTPSNPINLRLIISPAASPQSVLSCNHSPIPLSPRGDDRSRKGDSKNFLSPSAFYFRTKASSLPSILDSDTELDEKRDKGFPETNDSSSKSPTSVGSYGKYTTKLKNWKVPRFLRKHSDTPLHVMKKQDLADKSIHFLERGAAGHGMQSSNGYQQVPIVIESQDNKSRQQSTTKLNIPPLSHDMASFEREIIDIRSYLSQSRSNMSPFARSSSYRSQYGRSNNIEVPVCRARSSTITTQDEFIRPKDRRLNLPLPSPQPSRPADDVISLCPSVNSRKDSGIRSTSRRSSIQQQVNFDVPIFTYNIYALNHIATSHPDIMQHRVSGYYTSSQSSLNEHSRSRLPPPLSEEQVQSLQKLRKQSDLQLIRCVQDNARSGISYFVQPPLNRLTLFFKSSEIEKHYKDKAHRSDDSEDFPPTLTTSRFNTALDILVSAIIFLAVTASIFILYSDWRSSIGWFVFFMCIEIVAMALCSYRHYLKWKTNHEAVTESISRSVRIFRKLSNWFPWHMSGGLLISLPILAVLINFSCQNTTMTILRGEQSFYVYLLCISVVHFCNFTQMNWLVKNTLVTLYAGLFLFFAVLGCREANTRLLRDADIILRRSPQMFAQNITDYGLVNSSMIDVEDISNGTIGFDSHQHKLHLTELYLDIALLLMLVWFLNREFEISYRLSFYSNVVANRDKQRVQNMRNQADWLLHNIIPRHVADQLKNTAKYSENHKDVGIIFASIVNFNEMYDESYLKGKEYLRVLNELIADFDELLERPEFQHVEKIKTIGSTFMAASGLNPDLRHASRGTYDHLYQLMEFALEMQKVVDNFNQDLLEFDFILRIGYNFGDVTAGVIGTTKLYYDIWGDAVNIASRMDSTGVPKRIQVGEACIPVLSARYEFEQRGSVYVKGKDNMNVYLVVGSKDT